jgi:hypothetical protein
MLQTEPAHPFPKFRPHCSLYGIACSTSAGRIRMMRTTHTTRRKSLRVREFDSGRAAKGWRLPSSHLAMGPVPLPPRARWTATASIFQREVLKFRVQGSGRSHFFPGEIF